MIKPQYTYDTQGNKVGVFLAISDWNELKLIPGVKELSGSDSSLPEWQVKLGRKELENIASGNAELLEWEEAKKHFRL